MEISGYKAFDKNMRNWCGFEFEEGKTYHINGPIIFGRDGNGFHMSKRLEDTFRFVEKEGVIVARVTGFGEIVEGFDNYNEYFDMYSTSDIRIDRILSRNEIITLMLEKNELQVCRFISTGFKLTEDEINLFRKKFAYSSKVNQHLDYYMLGDEEAFKKKFVRPNILRR